MDDLTELQDSVRNLVARPGTFDTLFPETKEEYITSLLLDGLAEVQLEGLLLTVSYDEDGLLDQDITTGQGALIALFAGVRLLRAELLNRVMHKRYEAGTAVFEEDYNVTLYNQILKDLTAQKDRLTADLVTSATYEGGFDMADQYVHRLQPWHWLQAHPADA
ncbi:MAG: hypothetical protein EOO70_07815 [Myxococcaceae bacterium]|nr:MAG: hypothetical protein EOO70_07815 [Myxococcaceae bacterium]